MGIVLIFSFWTKYVLQRNWTPGSSPPNPNPTQPPPTASHCATPSEPLPPSFHQEGLMEVCWKYATVMIGRGLMDSWIDLQYLWLSVAWAQHTFCPTPTTHTHTPPFHFPHNIVKIYSYYTTVLRHLLVWPGGNPRSELHLQLLQLWAARGCRSGSRTGEGAI